MSWKKTKFPVGPGVPNPYGSQRIPIGDRMSKAVKDKAPAEAPAKAEKPKVEKKKEKASPDRAASKLRSMGPKGDPSGILKVEVHSRDSNTAVYVASVSTVQDGKERVLNQFMTKSLREALAFFENQVGRL